MNNIHLIIKGDTLVVFHEERLTTEQLRRDLRNLRQMQARAEQDGDTVHGFSAGEFRTFAARVEQELNQRLAQLN